MALFWAGPANEVASVKISGLTSRRFRVKLEIVSDKMRVNLIGGEGDFQKKPLKKRC
jgi:hypothetical protein